MTHKSSRPKRLKRDDHRFLLVTLTQQSTDADVKRFHEHLNEYIELENSHREKFTHPKPLVVLEHLEYVVEKTKAGDEHIHFGIILQKPGMNPDKFNTYVKRLYSDLQLPFFDIQPFNKPQTLLSYLNKEQDDDTDEKPRVISHTLFGSINVQEMLDSVWINKTRHAKTIAKLHAKEKKRLDTICIQHDTVNKSEILFNILATFMDRKDLIRSKDPHLLQFRHRYGTERLIREWKHVLLAEGLSSLDPIQELHKWWEGKDIHPSYTEEEIGTQAMDYIRSLGNCLNLRKNPQVKNVIVSGDTGVGKTRIIELLCGDDGPLSGNPIEITANGFVSQLDPFSHINYWDEVLSFSNDEQIRVLKKLFNDAFHGSTKGGWTELDNRVSLVVMSNNIGLLQDIKDPTTCDAIRRRFVDVTIMRDKDRHVDFDSIEWTCQRIISTIFTVCPEILRDQRDPITGICHEKEAPRRGKDPLISQRSKDAWARRKSITPIHSQNDETIPLPVLTPELIQEERKRQYQNTLNSIAQLKQKRENAHTDLTIPLQELSDHYRHIDRQIEQLTRELKKQYLTLEILEDEQKKTPNYPHPDTWIHHSDLSNLKE